MVLPRTVSVLTPSGKGFFLPNMTAEKHMRKKLNTPHTDSLTPSPLGISQDLFN
jgi:hypothetical protein